MTMPVLAALRPARHHPWVWLALVSVLVVLADRVWQAPHGLQATYFAGPDWQDGPGTERYVDVTPSTGVLAARRPDLSSRPFSVEWRGYLWVPRSGTYTFSLTSDDGASLFVRGALVVDNPGRHAPTEVRTSVPLPAGAQPIFIRYFQDGGGATFFLRWAREGQPLALLRSGSLLVGPVSTRWALGRRILDEATRVLVLVWLAALVVAGTLRLRRLRLEWTGWPDRLALGVLALSVAINVCGVWWALPNARGWAPDELVPADVLDALDARFSNGWHGKYPPLQYAVLSVAYTPVILASWVFGVDPREPGPYEVLFYVGRLTSVLFAAGIVWMVYRCGRELYGRTGAALGALTAAFMAPLPYYAKTANLESAYLFWFCVSLWAYIRILKRHARADYLVFAVAAALSVCTKDQAYGLFVLPPLAILFARMRRGLPVVDRTVVLAAVAAVATFVVAGNLLFNFSGFVEHVKVITGPASRDYQMFPGTLQGQAGMAALAARELGFIFGVPMTVVVVASLVWGLWRAPSTPALAWLLVPAVSYYLTFIGVVLYFYDRFLLPVGLVLALFVGAALERLVSSRGPMRRLRLAGAGAVFGYSLLYAVTVDVTLIRDSRIAVSRWIRMRVGPADTVAARGPLEYFLLAEGFDSASVESVDDVARIRPAFVVLNADHIARLAPAHRTRVMREHLASAGSGYRLAMRYRAAPLPLPGRHPDLGVVTRTPELSSLGQLNPPLDVFVRQDVAVRIGL